LGRYRLPDLLTRVLIKRQSNSIRIGANDDQMIAINQRAGGKPPHGRVVQMLLPDEFSVAYVAALQIALAAEGVKTTAVYRRRGPRAGVVAHRIIAGILLFPYFPAICFIK